MAVGLLGAGVAVAGQIGSDDQQGVAAAAVKPPGAAPQKIVQDETVSDDNPPDATVPVTTVNGRSTDASGRIELDVGDGDPIVVELDEFDDAVVGKLGECLGLPSFELHVGDGPLRPGDLPDDLDTWLDDVLSEWDVQVGTNHEGDLGSTFDDLFAEFGVTPDGQVTVTGPDGVSVIDIGEDGSVTISRNGDDITIETTGDATVSDLGDLVDDLGTLFGDQFDPDGELNLDDDLQRRIDEMLEGVPTPDELPDLGSVDPTEMQGCIDDALGR